MDESRKQFLEIFSKIMASDELRLPGDVIRICWEIWLASREALDIELTPACWRTYYPDTDECQFSPHSESGPESCARRIASEIGGYVVPVYHGKPQNCAAGIKVKE